MTAIALWVVGYFAVALPVASLLGRMMRRAAEAQTFSVDRLYATVLSTPIPEPSACAACGAADTGARAGLPPLPGAGSTPEHPAPAFSQPAQRAPGT